MDGSSEKVSVNMNVGTLSQIDLLVDLGYYSNRSDFINQSVRQSLDQKQSIIENEASRQRESNGDWFTGIYVVTKDQLVNAKERGKKVKISGYGVVVIDKKLDDLALEVIESIDIKGKILASQKTKEHFQGVPRNELT
jgi:Arc/MetJ-type ribon-helix-helix transcriptional regulator